MLDRILAKFRGQKDVSPQREVPSSAPSSRNVNVTGVYQGVEGAVPEFAQNADQFRLISECNKHAVCTFKPHIENQRIYDPSSGGMRIAYEGVSATCPAVKEFGQVVARADGCTRPYRYVDLAHIFACCCSDAKRCVFYSRSMAERARVDAQRQ